MGANLKTVFVVDVEATCWDNEEERGDRPNEVIEIGVVAMEVRTGAIFQKASIVVKPRFTEVSPFCTKLTGWTQADVDKGLNMADALVKFREDFKVTKDHVWFSCGEYDRVKLSSASGPTGVGHLYGIKRENNPFDKMRSHVNIKTLFALKHKLNREIGLDAMLKFIGEPLEGRHHNGADDAYNAAKIVRKILA